MPLKKVSSNSGAAQLDFCKSRMESRKLIIDVDYHLG